MPFTRALRELAARQLPQAACFATAIMELNHYIHTEFRYHPGITDVGTTVPDFLQAGEGVCQDFAHLMICLCRNAGIPSRYVSGYIETDAPANGNGSDGDTPLIGATASHAWVEVYTPNRCWIGLDPTNDKAEDERHIQIGIGRDYSDVTPLKGIFKGARRQRLNVDVKVLRNEIHNTGPLTGRPRPTPET